jgi:hypothetical protein
MDLVCTSPTSPSGLGTSPSTGTLHRHHRPSLKVLTLTAGMDTVRSKKIHAGRDGTFPFRVGGGMSRIGNYD